MGVETKIRFLSLSSPSQRENRCNKNHQYLQSKRSGHGYCHLAAGFLATSAPEWSKAIQVLFSSNIRFVNVECEYFISENRKLEKLHQKQPMIHSSGLMSQYIKTPSSTDREVKKRTTASSIKFHWKRSWATIEHQSNCTLSPIFERKLTQWFCSTVSEQLITVIWTFSWAAPTQLAEPRGTGGR